MMPKDIENVIGIKKFFLIDPNEVFLQVSNGPTPVSKSRITPKGNITWLKYVAPKVIWIPVNASENKGYKVPHKTAQQIDIKITLLNKKPLSRLKTDSKLFCDDKISFLYHKINILNKIIIIIKPKNQIPKSVAAKACIDDIIPLLVK